ncbi:MAG: lysozyme inhibitor LprI family protein [Pseudoalteromonas distincta]
MRTGSIAAPSRPHSAPVAARLRRTATRWLWLICLPLSACAGQAGQPAGAADQCAEAMTTIDINRCLHAQSQTAEEQLQHYLNAAREQHAELPEAVAAMDMAQDNWERFRNAHCAAVYSLWADGSIRGAMHNQCLLDETRQRTRQIWQVYLTTMDGGEVLPDPTAADAAAVGE